MFVFLFKKLLIIVLGTTQAILRLLSKTDPFGFHKPTKEILKSKFPRKKDIDHGTLIYWFCQFTSMEHR
ncbi:hypothetical protein DPMN_064375 [Dreissena polymorpha]|uniref:Uncharacterized protein n=1 Tax=Dreissena polymorpha TaxID=45954 RepID=A0A9D4CC47_DREPO|nr:hypothetical protein DPMN_064375 [Dreissena polymorpha]